MEEQNLPVYNLVISDDLESNVEVEFIALVDRPAIERNFLAFNEQEFVDPGATETEDEFIGRCIPAMMDEGMPQDQAAAVCYSKWEDKGKMAEVKYSFAIQDEEQRIISSPIIVADRKIYRADTNGEYFVVFPKETIKQIAIKFFKKGYQSNINLMHDSGQTVEGVTMFESWIKDSKRGIPGMEGFEDLPDGTWFGSFKVENDEVWAKVKAGELKGVSVEGIFNYKRTEKPVEEIMMAKVIDILQNIETK